MKRIAIVLGLLAAAACQRQDQQAPARPSKVVVDAMREYCRIGEIPREQWQDAQKAWGWHWAADKEMGPLWTRVAKKDRAAIAMVLAAADEGAGKGTCPILDVLRK
jgi:nitrous oxide reductase accessory protein NosL